MGACELREGGGGVWSSAAERERERARERVCVVWDVKHSGWVRTVGPDTARYCPRCPLCPLCSVARYSTQHCSSALQTCATELLLAHGQTVVPVGPVGQQRAGICQLRAALLHSICRSFTAARAGARFRLRTAETAVRPLRLTLECISCLCAPTCHDYTTTHVQYSRGPRHRTVHTHADIDAQAGTRRASVPTRHLARHLPSAISHQHYSNLQSPNRRLATHTTTPDPRTPDPHSPKHPSALHRGTAPGCPFDLHHPRLHCFAMLHTAHALPSA